MTKTFAELGLAEPLMRALVEEGYSTPTPIQSGAIPLLMQGRDLLGMAQTGTGKTAAFALPILHRLATDRRQPPRGGARVLVLAPTRELVSQIAASFSAMGRHLNIRVTTVFGGVGQGNQVAALKPGVDVLVAAPGRLLDLVGQRLCDLSQVEVLVLDEADQMLDMGFAKPIERIVGLLPRARHTLLFSATMPATIATLAARLLSDPAKVQITPPSTVVARIAQSVMFVDAQNKHPALLHVLKRPEVGQSVVFTLQKSTANQVAAFLNESGIPAEALHGNRSQGQRERALAAFRDNSVRVLVATDIAARGIDIDDVTHVVNFDLPNIAESYVHRIGRTARAGRSGYAVTLCEAEQRAWLRAVERETKGAIERNDDHPWHSEASANSTMRPPVLGGGGGNRGPRPQQPQPQAKREGRAWTEEEKLAARRMMQQGNRRRAA
jgi:ATP-dependent RNA helicase RhlE